MRVVTESGIPVAGCGTVGQAFDRVFGAETLEFLYGGDVRVGQWSPSHDAAKRTRRIQGGMHIEGAPAEVVRFLAGGRRLRATTRQDVVVHDADAIDVTHRVRMHFLGAELVRVKPSFRLRAQTGGPPLLDAEVRVAALFPPPIGGVIEGFMEHFARRQLAATRQLVGG